MPSSLRSSVVWGRDPLELSWLKIALRVQPHVPSSLVQQHAGAIGREAEKPTRSVSWSPQGESLLW